MKKVIVRAVTCIFVFFHSCLIESDPSGEYYQNAIVRNNTGHDVTIFTSYGVFFISNNNQTDTLNKHLVINGYFDILRLESLGNNVEYVFDDNKTLHHRYIISEDGGHSFSPEHNIMNHFSWAVERKGNSLKDSSAFIFTLTEEDYNLAISE